MKKLSLFLPVLVVLSACSSVRVSSDFDREADFASYKKYSFTKEAQELPVNDINRKRVLDAISNELAAKGFLPQTSPTFGSI